MANDLSILISAKFKDGVKGDLQEQLNKIKDLKINIQVDAKSIQGLSQSFHGLTNEVAKAQSQIKKFYVDSKLSDEGYKDLQARVNEIKQSADQFAKVTVQTYKNTNNIKSAVIEYRNEMGQLVKEQLSWTQYFDKQNNTTKKVFQPVGYTFVDDIAKQSKIAQDAIIETENKLNKLNDLKNKLTIGKLGINEGSSFDYLLQQYNRLIDMVKVAQSEERKLTNEEEKYYTNGIKLIDNRIFKIKQLQAQEAQSSKPLSGIYTESEFNLDKQKFSRAIQDYKTQLGSLFDVDAAKKLESEFGNINYATEGARQRVRELNEELKLLNTNANALSKIDQNSYKQQTLLNSANSLNVQYHGNVDKSSYNDLVNAIKAVDPASKTAEDDLKKLQLQLAQLRIEAMETSRTISSQLIHNMEKLIEWLSVSTVIFQAANAIRFLGQTIIETDKNLVELSKVLSSQTDFAQLMQDTVNVSNQYGRSITETQQALVNFGQAGYEAAQAIKLTDATLLGANVTGLKTADMANYLTGILTQFNMTAEQATDVINKLNEVDNNYSVTSLGLAQSLSRAGESAKEFGSSLDDVLAMTTIISQATHESGSVIGNMLKTSFARLNSEKTQEALAAIGVQVRDLNGDLRSATSIYADVAKQWDSMTRAQKTNTAEALSGKFQLNRMMALLDGWMDKEKGFAAIVKTSQNSFGSALEENQKHMQSLDAKMNQMSASAQELAFAIGEGGVKSAMSTTFDSVTTLVKGFTEAVEVTNNLTKGVDSFTLALGGMAIASALAATRIREMVATSAAFLLNMSPMAKAVTAIVAIGGAAVYSAGKQKQLNEEFEKTNGKTAEVWSTQREQVDQLLNKYEELAKAKDNGALSSDKEQEYYNVQKQLNLLLPQLTDHIDQNGHAIILRGEKLDQEKKRLDDLVVRWNDYIKAQGSDKLNNINSDIEAKKKRIDEINLALKMGSQIDNGSWFTPASVKTLSDADIAKLRVELIGLEGELGNLNNKSVTAIGNIVDGFVKLDQNTSQSLNNVITHIDLTGKDTNKLATSLGDTLKTLNNAKIGGDPKEIAFASAHLRELLGTYNVAPDVIQGFIDTMFGVKKATDEATKSTIDLNSIQLEISNGVANFEKSNKELADTYEKLAQGQNLSGKEIFDLISKYPELNSAVETHNGILTLSKDAVEAVMQAKENEFKIDLQTKQQELINQEKALTSKLTMYQKEIDAIESVATAKQAAAQAASKSISGLQQAGYDADFTTQEAISQGLESQFVDIGKIREQKNIIASLMSANLGASLGSTGKTPKEKSSPKDTYADKVFSALPTYKEQVDDLKSSIQSADDAVKALQSSIDVADKADDKKKKIELEKQLNQALEDRKAKYHEIANQMRDLRDNKLLSQFDSLFPDFRNGRNMEDIGKAEFATYENQLNQQLNDAENKAGHSGSVADKESVNQIKSKIEQFKYLSDTVIQADKDISDLGQKYVEDTAKIADNIKKIHQDELSVIDDGLQKQRDAIDVIDQQIQMSQARQALYNKGSKEYNDEETKQIQLMQQKIPLEQSFQQSVQDTLNTQKLTTEEQKKHNKELDDSIKKQYADQQAMNAKLNALADEVISAEKSAYSALKDAALKRYDDLAKAEDTRHQQVMNNLDAEMQREQDAINAKLKEIDQQSSTDDYNQQLSDAQKTLQDLQNQYNEKMLDDSIEGKAQRVDIAKQIATQQQAIAKLQSDREKELRKQNLNDQLDAYKKQTDAKKSAEDNAYNATKDSLDKQKQTTQEYYDGIINDEKKWAQQRQEILNGNFNSVKNNMMTLRGNIQGNMTAIGKTIGTNLIDQLTKSIQLMQQLQAMQGVHTTSSSSSSSSSSSTNTTSTYDPSTGEIKQNSTIGGYDYNGKHYDKLTDALHAAGAAGFKTGGWYTGDSQSEIPAILHPHEIVLNSDQTKDILEAVKVTRNINLPNITSMLSKINPISNNTNKSMTFNPTFNVTLSGTGDLKSQANELTDTVMNNLVSRMRSFGINFGV